ncbi:4-hydroxyphenylpyruvate [Ilyonectria robusta]
MDKANLVDKHRQENDAPLPGSTGRKHRKRPRNEPDDASTRSYEKARTRVSRACNPCRARKDRCDGQRPSCRSCVGAGRACNYEPSKKRGLPAGYVRSLEILLGLVFCTIEGSELCVSSILDSEATNSAVCFGPPVGGQRTAEDLLNAWRKSTVSRQVERLLVPNDAIEDEDESTNTFDDRVAQGLVAITTTHHVNDASSLDVVLEDAPNHINVDATSLRASVDLYSDSNTSPRPKTDISPRTGHMQLPPHWSHLLDRYFANTHCWFPISQKHDLLRAAHMLANNTKAPRLPDALSRGDCAFLWAVLGYLSHQSDRFNDPTDSSPNQRYTQRLCTTAKDLISDEEEEYQLGHVRALLVLALLQVDRGSWDSAWVVVGRAVSIATCLGVLPMAVRQAPIRTDDGARRVLLGCFILETQIASRLRRRPYFQRSDIQVIGLLQTDGMEEWEAWLPIFDPSQRQLNRNNSDRNIPGHVLSIFNCFAELMGFLNDLLRPPEGTPLRTWLQTIAHNFQTWKQGLPLPCQVPSYKCVSPQLLNLHIATHSISEAIRVEEMALTGALTRHAFSNTRSSIHDLHRMLQDPTHNVGSLTISPTVKTYLYTFDQSLELQQQFGGDPITKEQISSLRAFLGQLEGVFQKPATPLNMEWDGSLRTRVNDGAAETSIGNNFSKTTEFPPFEVQVASLTPVSLGVSVGKEGGRFQQPLPPYYEPTLQPRIFEGSETPRTATSEQALERRHSVRIERIFSQKDETGMHPGETNVNEARAALDLDGGSVLPADSLSSEIETDPLFDSLAILDQVDWLANAPDFMRPLGVFGDFPHDLENFLDVEPNLDQ